MQSTTPMLLGSQRPPNARTSRAGGYGRRAPCKTSTLPVTCGAQQERAPDLQKDSNTTSSAASNHEATDALEPASLPGLEVSQEDVAAPKQASEFQEVEIIEETEPVGLRFPEAGVTFAKNAAIAVVGYTIILTTFRAVRRFLSPRAKRKRTVNKNRELIDELLAYLPHKRQELTPHLAWMLKMKMGYSSTEIFRKYLWYLLREKKFNQEAVDDLVYLKGVLKMTDEDVAAALKERATRIYDKFGTLMLNTEGMTAAGIERKAAGSALFSKMLYLSKCPQLLDQDSAAARTADLRDIFGATEEDTNKLQIESLEEVDVDSLERMVLKSEDLHDSEDDMAEQ